MIKIYGTPICPHCVELKKRLDEKKKPYLYVNITESTKNLKEFLKLRDKDPLYDEVKKNGFIGIPTIQFEDGTLTLDWESLDLDSLPDEETADEMQEGSFCDFRTGRC